MMQFDLAAKQTPSFPRITDNSRLPSADFWNHFRHLILRKWNLLWKKQTNNKDPGDKTSSHPSVILRKKL